MMVRNTDRPLYFWIKAAGGIMKLNTDTKAWMHVQGNIVVHDIAVRYIRLHKNVTYAKFMDVISTLVNRYRTNWHHLPNDIQKIRGCRDDDAEVYVVYEQFDYVIYTRETQAFKIKEERRLKSELRKAKRRAKELLEKDPTTIVVNRLEDTWLENYKHIGTNNVPDILSDVPNIHEIPAGHPPGVYILMHKEEVVYVGQSVNPSARIGKHTQDKIFDRAFLIPTNDLLKVEAEYIKKFKPKYNKALNMA